MQPAQNYCNEALSVLFGINQHKLWDSSLLIAIYFHCQHIIFHSDVSILNHARPSNWTFKSNYPFFNRKYMQIFNLYRFTHSTVTVKYQEPVDFEYLFIYANTNKISIFHYNITFASSC